MNKAILLIVLGLVSTSCGPLAPSTVKTKRTVDTDLEPYVQMFEKEYGKEIDFSVSLNEISEGSEDGSTYVGICRKWTTGRREVEIDVNFYYDATENQLKQAVMHELGHCVLDREHDDTIWYVDGLKLKRSVMSTYVFSKWAADKFVYYYDNYIDELFNGPYSE